MVWPVVAYEIKGALVIQNRLDLTSEEIHTCWWLCLVGMTNVKETIFGYSATSLLPYATHLSLALLQKMSGSCHSMIFITLQLMKAICCAFIGNDILQKNGI